MCESQWRCALQLLAVRGPFQSWSPVRQSVAQTSLHRVDLLLGTSELDGLIGRARRIKVRGHDLRTFPLQSSGMRTRVSSRLCSGLRGSAWPC